jgi:predicted porin
MKKSFLALAALGAFASVAHAQSSVTLYGLVDAGLSYTNNVQSAPGESGARWAQSSGAASASRWGLRGAEDLGGGLKAIFTLENGFEVNNGSLSQSGKMFGRQAFVGLQSQFGTVTLGRQYDSAVDYLAPLSAVGTWGGTYFAHPFDMDNLNASTSSNNTVKFTSANYAGFTGGGTYSFSNEAGAFANNRQYSFGAQYVNAGLRVGAAYVQANNAGGNTTGAIDQGSTLASAITGVTGAGLRDRIFGAGASYAFGPANVGVLWTQSRLDNVEGAPGVSARANNYEVNAKYNVTPALSAGIAYTFTDGRVYANGNNAPQRWSQVGAQADYALSRRTDVYAEAVYQRTLESNGLSAAIFGAGGSSSTQNQVSAAVGLRHRF